MKAALPVAVVVALGLTFPASAAVDWQTACATVGDFAGLVAAERDQKRPERAATATARRILGRPPILTREVGAEITRQVYRTPDLSPEQETATMRSKCLAPTDTTPAAKPAPIPPPPPMKIAANPVKVLAPIELHTGENRIPNFTPDGRDGAITLTWQDDGEGRGHDVFTVAIPDAGPVGVAGGDAITDDPGNDRDMRRSVRFARGQVDGANTTLLLIADRQPGGGPTPTRYRVYQLVRQGGRDWFAPLENEPMLASFCNADMALSIASGLPLRASYRGPRTANGCPESPE